MTDMRAAMLSPLRGDRLAEVLGEGLAHRAAVPALLFVWFAATAWLRPLAVPDEGRYLSVAWEMLASGNWAVPTLDGLPFFHKPPLFYWLAAAAMRVMGVIPFAGRMPSLLAATALAWAMYRFTLAWSGASQARIGLVILATMPYFYFGAQYANMDMLVAACIGLCVLLAAHAALVAARGGRARTALWAAYAFAALGMLAKGLIGCALPGAVVLGWLVATRRTDLVARLLSPTGLAIFLAIALPWPLAMQARYPGFLDYAVMGQQVQRFLGAGFNNAEPWWFYGPVLFVLCLPWAAGLPALFARRREAHDAQPSLRVLMMCWLVVVVAFFSVPQSKLIGYVLPAVPPLAWLLAEAIAAHRLRGLGANLRTLAGGAAVVLVTAVVAYGIRAPHSSRVLSQALVQQRGPADRVVFFDTYPYDLVFSVRLRPPIPVVGRWAEAAADPVDGWARELADGAQFAPQVAAITLARSPVVASPGSGGRTWVVSPARHGTPAGEHAQVVARTGELALWRVDP